jgi:peptidyl-prolyl cis-trans isomerase B (cyclophilin B)
MSTVEMIRLWLYDITIHIRRIINMKAKLVLIVALMMFLLTGCGGSGSDAADTYTPAALDADATYYADIDIADYGIITVQLDQEAAPVTCANFVELAESGFYDSLTFHRIIAAFMMQGGDPLGNGTGGSENNIVGEFASNGIDNNLSHERGVISMARSGDPNSASSQFFICHENSDFLDGDYAAFGIVTEGLDVVDAVCTEAQPTDDNGTIPAEAQPVIKAVTIRAE